MVSTLRRGAKFDDDIPTPTAAGELIPQWVRELFAHLDKRFDRIEHQIAETKSEQKLPPFDFVPAKAAAEYVGYDYESVRRWAKQGKITASKIGGSWYVAMDSLLAYVGEKGSTKGKARLAKTSNR